jgi:hypothetical protein
MAMNNCTENKDTVCIVSGAAPENSLWMRVCYGFLSVITVCCICCGDFEADTGPSGSETLKAMPSSQRPGCPEDDNVTETGDGQEDVVKESLLINEGGAGLHQRHSTRE